MISQELPWINNVFEKLDALPKDCECCVSKIKEVFLKNLDSLKELPSYGVYFPLKEAILVTLSNSQVEVFHPNTMQCIGKGSAGSVFRLLQSDSQAEQMALKIPIASDAKYVRQIQTEIRTLEKVHAKRPIEGIQKSSSCLIYQYDPVNDCLDLKNPYGFLSSLYSEGTLADFLPKYCVANRTLSSDKAVAIMNRLIQSNAELRRDQYYSTDIKPENILVHLQKKDEEGDFTIKADMADLWIEDVSEEGMKARIQNPRLLATVTLNSISYLDYHKLFETQVLCAKNASTDPEKYKLAVEERQKTLEKVLVRELGLIAYYCFYGIRWSPIGMRQDPEKKGYFLFDKICVRSNINIDERIRSTIEQMIRQAISFDEVENRWSGFSAFLDDPNNGNNHSYKNG